jgi:hypothetical protein
MKTLHITLLATLLAGCGSPDKGDHRILAEATQAQWLEGSVANRQATAHFWAWNFAGKPGPNKAHLVDKAASNLLECINAVDVSDMSLMAKDTAAGCWAIMSAN